MEERSNMSDSRSIALSERFREAYEARDVERLVELFADDAELTWAVGTFRGKDAIRKVFEWDIRLSPTAVVHDAGIGVVALGHTLISERVVNLTAEGIPYEERAVSIMELNDDGLIRSLRSYYDKLAIMQQVASGYPGIRGRVFRAVTGSLARLGSKGLEVSPN
jgi:ketosteroid isomerase-like protein